MDMDPHYIMTVCTAIRATYYYTKICYISYTIPKAQWDTISVDFIVELPESYEAVMNIVDSVSKHAHFIPTNTTITALRATRLYLRHMWKHHGLLRQVMSD